MALSVAVGADCASGAAPDNATLRAALAAYLDLGGRPVISRGPTGAAAASAGARARARAGRERPVPVRRAGAGAGSFYRPDPCAAASTPIAVPPLAATRRLGARRVSTFKTGLVQRLLCGSTSGRRGLYKRGPSSCLIGGFDGTGAFDRIKGRIAGRARTGRRDET